MKHLPRKRYLLAAGLALMYVALSAAYAPTVLDYGRVDHGALLDRDGIAPEFFLKEMEFLRAHQYRVLGLSEFMDVIRDPRRGAGKVVALTFDGGFDGHFVYVFPVLKRLGFAGTFFVRAANIGKPGFMTAEDLAILLENSMEVGVIGEPGQSPSLDRDQVAALIKNPVNFYAFCGATNETGLKSEVARSGFRGAVVEPGDGGGTRDPFALRRVRMGGAGRSLWLLWFKTGGFWSWMEDAGQWLSGTNR